MPSPSFEINKVLKIEAEELVAARERAFSIHHTGDIDAAGDEIEKKVRDVIRRKLPLDYYIGHGHIVDEALNYNGQHDMIIADNSGSPILFKTENGTEYFPYESVYAVGEIKSTYKASSKYVEKFIDDAKKLHTDLSRVATSPNQLTKDLLINFQGGISFTPGHNRPYRNPIFKLMFFVDAGDFNFEKLMPLYDATEDKFLPNVICILNRGILVKSKISDGKISTTELFPEFILPENKAEYKWTFIELGEGADPLAAHLAYVHFALNQHLRDCIVTRPNLMTYFSNLFKVKSALAFTPPDK